jgi:DNA repair protein RecN (Recombination protein N)
MSLLELAVADLALIDRARIRLRPGLTVITGETGAGKSLLIDALALVLGGRADPGMVRGGTDQARVEALFDLPDRDEPLIAVREVGAAGRSIARLDDRAVTAAALGAATGPLVEIHGQHEQQRLLQPAWQRDVLDAYAGHAALRDKVESAFEAWEANLVALEALEAGADDLERRLELAEHALEEIESAGPRAGELDELRAALARSADATRIVRLADELRDGLVGERTGVRDLLARAAQAAAELGRLAPEIGALEARLDGLAAEVEDAAADLVNVADAAELEPAAAARLEERIGLLYGLLRKYGPTEADLLAADAAARDEVQRLRAATGERDRRLAAGPGLEAAAREAAADLTVARRAAADRLGTATSEVLGDLGFGAAQLTVLVAPAALGRTGADEVTFVLASNPGEPARPLARIASGGELSRVALALKVVLASADATPTLVFDEIDAGVGARSAEPIGRLLHRLAEGRQVFVVTHLAQIAAHADHHLLIEKVRQDERTVTRARELDERDEEGRLEELAAMLAGADAARAEPATAAARDLLARARAGSSAA